MTDKPSPPWLSASLAALEAGAVVACPTETLIGLLADAFSHRAVQRVVSLKRRGPDPIALLLPSIEALASVAETVPEAAEELARRYWPGPLTIVVPARSGLPSALAPNGTIGVRVPGESPALTLVSAFGRPLTATSCNHSGSPPAKTSEEAHALFGDELAVVVPGSSPGGPPSTVVDATGPELRILRAGAVSLSV